jgi:hypothetical protein
VAGAGASLVEVSSMIERQAVPVFSYAAFATHHGCNALSFAGGATTQSYDSGLPLVGGSPAVSNTDGNVGTNGNLAGVGDPTTIYGTLSTPRAGVGDCTSSNVTAATISGWGTVEEGLITLPQPITLPTPPPLSPPPSMTNYGGTGNVKVTGGTDTAALLYAPNASASLAGASTHFYGAIVSNRVTSTGGFNLYYDRRLRNSAMTAGNPTMTTFTWRTF